MEKCADWHKSTHGEAPHDQRRRLSPQRGRDDPARPARLIGSDKGRLLTLAEAWLDLADRTRRITANLRGPRILHPLIREKLDRYVDEP